MQLSREREREQRVKSREASNIEKCQELNLKQEEEDREDRKRQLVKIGRKALPEKPAESGIQRMHS